MVGTVGLPLTGRPDEESPKKVALLQRLPGLAGQRIGQQAVFHRSPIAMRDVAVAIRALRCSSALWHLDWYHRTREDSSYQTMGENEAVVFGAEGQKVNGTEFYWCVLHTHEADPRVSGFPSWQVHGHFLVMLPFPVPSKTGTHRRYNCRKVPRSVCLEAVLPLLTLVPDQVLRKRMQRCSTCCRRRSCCAPVTRQMQVLLVACRASLTIVPPSQVVPCLAYRGPGVGCLGWSRFPSLAPNSQSPSSRQSLQPLTSHLFPPFRSLSSFSTPHRRSALVNISSSFVFLFLLSNHSIQDSPLTLSRPSTTLLCNQLLFSPFLKTLLCYTPFGTNRLYPITHCRLFILSLLRPVNI